MIVPSIDIMNGIAVQLKQGRDHLLSDPRDPVELARTFGRFGPVAIVDLDAALGKGSNNTELISRCCRVAECRVGGGIRKAGDVRKWIKRGARKVVVGTMATPEFLAQFPRDWLVAAVDAQGNHVVDHGWTRETGVDVLTHARRLAPHCSELLFTQVEREGMLAGADLETAIRLRDAVDVPITVAGGITTVNDVRELATQGFASQIGRAVYERRLDLTDAWLACVSFNVDGLVPTVAQCATTREVLMLAWSNEDSLRMALRDGVGCYWSRSRRELWRKGATSGHSQELVSARCDCDGDTVLFRVEQAGPACHTGRQTCFGNRTGGTIAELYALLDERNRTRRQAATTSYTQRLLGDPQLLDAKLREETEEVIGAPNLDNLRWECADLIYHLLVKMVSAGITPEDVDAELRGRMK